MLCHKLHKEIIGHSETQNAKHGVCSFRVHEMIGIISTLRFRNRAPSRRLLKYHLVHGNHRAQGAGDVDRPLCFRRAQISRIQNNRGKERHQRTKRVEHHHNFHTLLRLRRGDRKPFTAAPAIGFQILIRSPALWTEHEPTSLAEPSLPNNPPAACLSASDSDASVRSTDFSRVVLCLGEVLG